MLEIEERLVERIARALDILNECPVLLGRRAQRKLLVEQAAYAWTLIYDYMAKGVGVCSL